MPVEKHRSGPKHTQEAKGHGHAGWYQSKKKEVAAHAQLRGNCLICNKSHSTNSHRDHGAGSFRKTHKHKRAKAKVKGSRKKIGLRAKARDVGSFVRRK